MKQLVILSGKGGTGKTTVSAAFIYLSSAKAFADCDVDAPNLHLVSKVSQTPQTRDYFGLQKAKINQSLCIKCGICADKCRFNAINFEGEYTVDKYACEGCAVCHLVCPVGAVNMYDHAAGELKLYKNGDTFSTAALNIGSGTSGLLVSEVKKQLENNVSARELAIIDGSPGIGCPVIASLSGADYALIVAEPSLSGISDMERIIKTASHFEVDCAVCINKSDTNGQISQTIKTFCEKNSLPFVGEIPYDTAAVKAVNDGLSIAQVDCISGSAMKVVYKNLLNILESKGVI